MKKLSVILISLGFFLPFTASAACSPVALGGTGNCTLTSTDVLFGNGTSPIATSSAFTFTTAASRLNVTNASTTNVNISNDLWLTNISIPAGTFLATDPNGLVIATSSPASSTGTGNVSTSSSETATRVPFWTSTSATPALLSGGSNNFKWDNVNNILNALHLTSYASSTIGDGTQAGGLTISGGATSTGNVLINTGATGTTTMQIGQATNPACIISRDTADGGFSYTYWKAGIMYVSTTACN